MSKVICFQLIFCLAVLGHMFCLMWWLTTVCKGVLPLESLATIFLLLHSLWSFQLQSRCQSRFQTLQKISDNFKNPFWLVFANSLHLQCVHFLPKEIGKSSSCFCLEPQCLQPFLKVNVIPILSICLDRLDQNLQADVGKAVNENADGWMTPSLIILISTPRMMRLT